MSINNIDKKYLIYVLVISHNYCFLSFTDIFAIVAMMLH